jgi:hypothetical protein
MRKHLIRISFVLSFYSSCAFAQITWDSRQLDFHPSLQDTNVVARFTFTNAGNRPVEITSIKSSCDCTTAKLDKKNYLPNEKGEITVTFNIGRRTGLQQKSVIVQTNDPTDPFVQLTLRAFVPELIKISPGSLTWGKGDKNEPKSIALKVVHDSPIRIVGVQSTNDAFFPQLKTIEVGKEYSITVSASDISEVAKGTLRIETDFPKDKPRIFYAFVEIKDPNNVVGAQKQGPSVDLAVPRAQQDLGVAPTQQSNLANP